MLSMVILWHSCMWKHRESPGQAGMDSSEVEETSEKREVINRPRAEKCALLALNQLKGFALGGWGGKGRQRNECLS